MVGQHLFMNIIPNDFTDGTGWKVWCDWNMSGVPQHNQFDIRLMPSLVDSPIIEIYNLHRGEPYAMGSLCVSHSGMP